MKLHPIPEHSGEIPEVKLPPGTHLDPQLDENWTEEDLAKLKRAEPKPAETR